MTSTKQPNNNAVPRYETAPTPDSLTWDDDIRATATRLSTPLMPWQQKGARLLGELSDELCTGTGPCSDHDPKPLPRYKTVIVSVPRQQGKTVLSRAAVTTVAESLDDAELYGTAQTRGYAAKHVVKLGQALKRVDKEIKVTQGIGNEAIKWKNGSTYLPISPTEGGGHGDSIDFMLIDEGWAISHSTMGGVSPAMIARPHSQMLVISTMGSLDSEVWNGLVKMGREAAEGDGSNRGRIAYIEYAAPTDEAVFEDTCTDDSKIGTKDCVWGQWMPALGITVTHAAIWSSIEAMLANPEEGRNGVVRAFGNRTVAQLVNVFPSDWVSSAWKVIEPPSRFVLAIDVNEEPVGASISTGHLASNDTSALRVVEWRYGTPNWVIDKARELIRARDVEAVVADLGGPTRQIQKELRVLCDEELVPLVDRPPRDFAADTQRFYDHLRESRVALEKSEPLELSIAGAVRKDFGDSGLWVVNRRRMTADASPLISSILAHGVAVELGVSPVVEFVWFNN